MGYVPEHDYFVDYDQTEERTFGGIQLWTRSEHIRVYGALIELNVATHRLFERDGAGGTRPVASIANWLSDIGRDVHCDLLPPRVDPFSKFDVIERDWALSVKFKKASDRDRFIAFVGDVVFNRVGGHQQ